MKDSIEYAVWQLALHRNVDPGVILTTFWLDLPMSNGKISFCVTLNHKFRQPTAQPQKKTTGWSYRDPEPVRGVLIFPEAVCRYIRRILKNHGIPHVIGIHSEDSFFPLRRENPAEYIN